jgi:UTP--glucose-1-phosphate uridylyltransferase
VQRLPPLFHPQLAFVTAQGVAAGGIFLREQCFGQFGERLQQVTVLVQRFDQEVQRRPVIVVQPQDLDGFRALFTEQISIENYNKLPRPFQDYARRLLEIGRQVRFVTQAVQDGFGHAVYCAREAMGGDPFLLMLGDHLYRANGGASCARQVVEAFERAGVSVVGLRRTPEADIAAFGTAAGVWIEPERRLEITEFAEKPTTDYARSHLRVAGLPEDEYLTVFGQYVLTPRLFDILEEHIHNNVRERGEFQLTSALDRLRQDEGFEGVIVDGRRFDIGLPDHYLATLAAFRAD